jgi:UDP-N-acetylglucosamine 4-epimerase
MNRYDQVKKQLARKPRTWVITGVAGFIGSNLLETLLRLDQRVCGIDSLFSGKLTNLDEAKSAVNTKQWQRFHFINADIRQPQICLRACRGADYVLHQAALGSVPLSIREPLLCNSVNVEGFLQVLLAAKQQGVKRLVYASTSALYGNSSRLPKSEDFPAECLSPYAASKRADELYADALARVGGMSVVGLRYFNVFGPRQDPHGPYAAVIPQWTASLLQGKKVKINGDGKTTRDFCYIADVVQANLLAATIPRLPRANPVYNVAAGRQISLIRLFETLRDRLATSGRQLKSARPVYGPFRAGDVRYSQADIGKAKLELGYEVRYPFEKGIQETLQWHGARENLRHAPA